MKEIIKSFFLFGMLSFACLQCSSKKVLISKDDSLSFLSTVFSGSVMVLEPTGLEDYYHIQLNRLNEEKIWFSSADSVSMVSQIKSPKIYCGTGSILCSSFVDSLYLNGGWKTLSKHYPKGYYSVHLPVFNCEKDIVLLKYRYQCGSTCGFQKLSLFVKHNGNWREMYVYYYIKK